MVQKMILDRRQTAHPLNGVGAAEYRGRSNIEQLGRGAFYEILRYSKNPLERQTRRVGDCSRAT
jgi:hypothetical protein